MTENYPGLSSNIREPIVQNSLTDIEAPEAIFLNANAARGWYLRVRGEHLRRIQLYAAIEGQLSGNPPYNPADLARHKLEHVSNFNTLDARALYERGALSYWNLLNEAEYLATFELATKDPQAVNWANILSRNWDFVVRKWPSFYTQVNTLTAQLVKLGVSCCIFPDERDWRWRTIELSRFFVPDQALADMDQLTGIAVETTFTVQYLFETYLKFKKDKDSPWDIEELVKLLIQRANTFMKPDSAGADMMELQRRYQNRDLTWSDFFSDSIRIVSLFYKEYDGKISHYMFDRFEGGFLFKNIGQYEEMREGVCIFTASPGEFTIHSNRGLGHKIYSGCQAMMQLDCSTVDMARWAATPILKSAATGSKDVEAIRFYTGVPTNIGTAELQQNTIGANINQLIGVSQYLLSKLQFNLANSGDDPSGPDKDKGSISPTEARMRSFKEFNVLKNYVAHFYAQFDPVVEQMTIKLMHSKEGYEGHEYAKEWKDRCIAEGVPPEIFDLSGAKRHQLPKQIWRVGATRVAGDGSTLAKILGLEGLAPDVGAFPAAGQQEYLKMKVSSYLGPQYVKAFMPPSAPDEISGGASLATLENNDMSQGQAPRFSPDNQQRSHIVTHLTLGKSIIQQIQQNQLTPVQADKTFSTLIPHLAEHLQFVARNPYERGFLAQIKEGWNDLSEYARLNRKNATAQLRSELKKRQQQAEQQQTAMSDADRKDFVAKRDVERADYKVTSQVRRADEAGKVRAEVSREKVQSDAQTDRMKIRLEADNNSLENTPTQDLQKQISDINGATIAPNDFEEVPQ